MYFWYCFSFYNKNYQKWIPHECIYINTKCAVNTLMVALAFNIEHTSILNIKNKRMVLSDYVSGTDESTKC